MDSEDKIIGKIVSGDSNKVNSAIGEMREWDNKKRVRLFEGRFDDLRELYGRERDGYKRQSIVRFLDYLFHPDVGEKNIESLREFFLDCFEDDDGRVRLAALRGLKGLLPYMEIIGGEKHLISCLSRLEEMKKKFSEKRKEHVEKAIEHVDFFLLPDDVRILEGMYRLLERRKTKTGGQRKNNTDKVVE